MTVSSSWNISLLLGCWAPQELPQAVLFMLSGIGRTSLTQSWKEEIMISNKQAVLHDNMTSNAFEPGQAEPALAQLVAFSVNLNLKVLGIKSGSLSCCAGAVHPHCIPIIIFMHFYYKSQLHSLSVRAHWSRDGTGNFGPGPVLTMARAQRSRA